MVLTVLEAEVSPKRWNDLKTNFENMRRTLPASAITPVQAFLVQSREDVNVWRLVGIWRSREEFEQMRQQGTPRGVKLFQDLGAEPSLSVYDVIGAMNPAEVAPMSQH